MNVPGMSGTKDRVYENFKDVFRGGLLCRIGGDDIGIM